MYGHLKCKRIIPICFLVTWPKAYEIILQILTTPTRNQSTITYTRVTILKDERKQNCNTQKASRQWTNTQRRGRETDPVLGNLWYFHLCGCNTLAVQYLSWTWAACMWVQKNWRFVSTYISDFCFLCQGNFTTWGHIKLLPGWEILWL